MLNVLIFTHVVLASTHAGTASTVGQCDISQLALDEHWLFPSSSQTMSLLQTQSVKTQPLLQMQAVKAKRVEVGRNEAEHSIDSLAGFGAIGWFVAAVLACWATAPSMKTAGAKATYEELWPYARHTGFFACFIAQASWLYYFFLANKAADPHFGTYFWPISPDLPTLVAMDICAELVRRMVTYNAKYVIFCICFGMSKEDYVFAKGARSEWTESDVAHFSEKYGAHNIKVMDAINRRLGHVIVNVWRIVLLGFLARSISGRLQLLIVSAVISTSWRFLLEHSKSNVASFMFAGARISDGRFGRFNQVIVSFFSSAGKILAILIFLRSSSPLCDTETEMGSLIGLALVPLLWGDTFGELVGSFWGRLQFPVLGLGQGAKHKTVEGTVAVWMSSTIGLLVKIAIRPLPPSLAHWMPLHLAAIVAFAATAGEALAPCGTDNYSVVVSSAIALAVMRRC
eukprot:TRINITY_DN536_c0_g1_i1.p1 TRINITY_DN536_c0_g1~~TRINITY_DN536_c0_g1_i1.p1  ORF type:complete len:456 (+),score=41.16 TRINITY_DN536_c0_g1_i1:90-1457(+)